MASLLQSLNSRLNARDEFLLYNRNATDVIPLHVVIRRVVAEFILLGATDIVRCQAVPTRGVIRAASTLAMVAEKVAVRWCESR